MRVRGETEGPVTWARRSLHGHEAAGKAAILLGAGRLPWPGAAPREARSPRRPLGAIQGAGEEDETST